MISNILKFNNLSLKNNLISQYQALIEKYLFF